MSILPTRVAAIGLLLFAAGACAAPAADSHKAILETGAHAGAAYRIDIPAGWNGELVVFFHGYATDTVSYRDDPPQGLIKPIVDRGFAVIQSGYSATGWAIERAALDSESLRVYFVGKFGRPKRTLAMGMSMGGTLTVMALESKPEIYAGGLSLCGVLEASDRFLQRDFALRAAFDYYFPDLLGPLVPVPADYLPSVKVEKSIHDAMLSKPQAAAALLRLYGVADMNSFPGVLAFIGYEVKDLQQRTGGNPFGNADLIYTGSNDDDALNNGVHRYYAEAKALAYASRYYTPSGKLLRPLLALHTTRDPLVPASTAFEYALVAQRAGHGDNFVQQFIAAEGHCTMNLEQTGRAFDELLDWVSNARRPASGAFRDPTP
jgi:acetyl esterase/lipase